VVLINVTILIKTDVNYPQRYKSEIYLQYFYFISTAAFTQAIYILSYSVIEPCPCILVSVMPLMKKVELFKSKKIEVLIKYESC